MAALLAVYADPSPRGRVLTGFNSPPRARLVARARAIANVNALTRASFRNSSPLVVRLDGTDLNAVATLLAVYADASPRGRVLTGFNSPPRARLVAR